jgi:hypothetical protein
MSCIRIGLEYVRCDSCSFPLDHNHPWILWIFNQKIWGEGGKNKKNKNSSDCNIVSFHM